MRKLISSIGLFVVASTAIAVAQPVPPAGLRQVTRDSTLTGNGTTASPLGVADGAVTFGKMQDVTAPTILGRTTAGAGSIEAMTATQATALLNTVTTSAKGLVPTAPNNTSQWLRGDGAWATLVGVTDGDKGDLTVSGSGATWTIGNSAVTLAKMANLSQATIIGRASGAGTGVPTALTGTQATAILDLYSTSTTTKGLVPGANNVGATYYLDGSGAWSIPSGAGDITAVVAGGGLTGGGTSGSVTLDVNPGAGLMINGADQVRMISTCADGQVLKSTGSGTDWVCANGSGGKTEAVSTAGGSQTLAVAAPTRLVQYTASASTTLVGIARSGGNVDGDELDLVIEDGNIVTVTAESGLATDINRISTNGDGSSWPFRGPAVLTFRYTGGSTNRWRFGPVANRLPTLTVTGTGSFGTTLTVASLTQLNSAGLIATNTGSTSQVRIRASATNEQGFSGLTVISSDDITAGFDIGRSSSTWIAGDTSWAALTKYGDKLMVIGATGTSAGTNVSTEFGTARSNPIATFDPSNSSTKVTGFDTTVQDVTLSSGSNSITLNDATTTINATYLGTSEATIDTITGGRHGRAVRLIVNVSCVGCEGAAAVRLGVAGNIAPVFWRGSSGASDPIGRTLAIGHEEVSRVQVDLTYTTGASGWIVDDLPYRIPTLSIDSAGQFSYINISGGGQIYANAGGLNLGGPIDVIGTGQQVHFLRKTTLVTGSTTFFLTSYTKKIRIRAVGGGGGGGGADGVTSARSAGGGGGSGIYGEVWIGGDNGWTSIGSTASSTNGAIAITIGSAGSGGSGASPGGQGGTGGNTTVAYDVNASGSLTTLTFYGGNGGYNGYTTSGTSFSASAVGCPGTNAVGTSGPTTLRAVLSFTGSCGGLGVTGSGSMFGGNGGSNPLGVGPGGVWNNAGNAAAGYGAGGGGGSTETSTDRNGGAGAAGAVIVEEYN